MPVVGARSAVTPGAGRAPPIVSAWRGGARRGRHGARRPRRGRGDGRGRAGGERLTPEGGHRPSHRYAVPPGHLVTMKQPELTINPDKRAQRMMAKRDTDDMWLGEGI